MDENLENKEDYKKNKIIELKKEEKEEGKDENKKKEFNEMENKNDIIMNKINLEKNIKEEDKCLLEKEKDKKFIQKKGNNSLYIDLKFLII